MRSPTAAEVARRLWALETDYAGLSNDADEKLSREQIDWAEWILVMEPRHRRRLTALFGPALSGRKVSVLDIPDRYGFMDDTLVALLEQRLARHFGPVR